MDDREIFREYSGFKFSKVLVRASNIIGFLAQKWNNLDPLEQRDTAVFFFYPDEPKGGQWYVQYLGEATGLNGCAAFKPSERWVFVADDGQVYVVGHGDNDWEQPVSSEANMFFSNVKAVRRGHAIAVGPKRHVYMRTSKNNWTHLDGGLYPQGASTDLEYAGFSDIDGFSEKDMYACGGHGDLWHYNGHMWSQVDIPTNTVLENICCTEGGLVYITTNQRKLLRGRKDSWEIMEQNVTKKGFESIVEYGSHILVSTVSEILVVDGDDLRKWDVGMPKMKSSAYLATNDGILVVAGGTEALIYDRQSWTRIPVGL